MATLHCMFRFRIPTLEGMVLGFVRIASGSARALDTCVSPDFKAANSANLYRAASHQSIEYFPIVNRNPY